MMNFFRYLYVYMLFLFLDQCRISLSGFTMVGQQEEHYLACRNPALADPEVLSLGLGQSSNKPQK